MYIQAGLSILGALITISTLTRQPALARGQYDPVDESIEMELVCSADV